MKYPKRRGSAEKRYTSGYLTFFKDPVMDRNSRGEGDPLFECMLSPPTPLTGPGFSLKKALNLRRETPPFLVPIRTGGSEVKNVFSCRICGNKTTTVLWRIFLAGKTGPG